MEAKSPTAHPQLKGAGAKGGGDKKGDGKENGKGYGWKEGGKYGGKSGNYRGRGKEGKGVTSLDTMGLWDPYQDWIGTPAWGS